MSRSNSILVVFVALFIGCGPSPKEKYDAAVQEVDRQQAQLDKLRPAYDAAVVTATNAVCREITGTSPEESESAAAQQVSDALTQLTAAPDESKKVDGAKVAPTGKKGDELDKIIENAAAAQKDLQAKQAALTAPVAKVGEVKKVMNNIKTEGTPENKRFKEKLAEYQEVKTYERQQKRLERAQQELEEAEKDLPGGGDKKADNK